MKDRLNNENSQTPFRGWGHLPKYHLPVSIQPNKYEKQNGESE
jgi:hypothetical protein